ncbi:uncharacterized protein [Aegilops tauschii subsp. strangulata]|uniref:uncharacterized protein n=1 Tax=Aegilops tauschii subsp. strangulata TaxID=200361 RepID=UPI003CC84938
MLVGDFNMYRFEHEKSKGRRNWTLMDTFNSWIREHALDDIEITNRTFTWFNKRVQPTLVKLDRVLVNAEWNLGFADTTSTTLPAVTSDHILIGVDMCREAPKCSFFRFENHWLLMPEARELINESWQRGSRVFASMATLLNFKLRRVRATVRKWDRAKKPLQLTMDNCKHVV